MVRRHSISEARSKLPKLVREAEAGRAVELTRRGERVAVLIGQKEYEHLLTRSRRFSEAWADFISAVKLKDLGIDPDEVFGGARDQRPGRVADL